MSKLNSRGFTLMEILVVLIIMSIVVSIATITISHNKNKRIEVLARELTELITLAQEQAMLQPVVLGLVVTDNNFYFDSYQVRSQGKPPMWSPAKQAILGKRAIPNDISVTVQQGGKVVGAVAGGEPKPQVMITTSGEVTPFVIYIGEYGRKPRFMIVGETDGRILLKTL